MEGTAKKQVRQSYLHSPNHHSIPSYWLGEDDIEGGGEGSLGTLKKKI